MTATEQSFDAIEWHDAVLLSLNIDRRTPGTHDEVIMVVEWLDGRQQSVRFMDCYALDAQMNFGVAARESLRAARCIADSPQLTEIRQRWSKLGVTLENLRCFEFTTNSTASIIRIFARKFEVSVQECGQGGGSG